MVVDVTELVDVMIDVAVEVTVVVGAGLLPRPQPAAQNEKAVTTATTVRRDPPRLYSHMAIVLFCEIGHTLNVTIALLTKNCYARNCSIKATDDLAVQIELRGPWQTRVLNSLHHHVGEA